MKKKTIFILVLLAVVWRLFLSIHWGLLTKPDSLSYDTLARNIAAGQGYIDTRPYQPLDASLTRTPGYPLFLAGIRLVFPGSDWIIILIQNLLGLLTAWMIYRIGARLIDERTGILAGLITAFHPWLIQYGNTLMSEILFMFLATLSILLLVHGLPKKSWAVVGTAGIVLGAALLVRPALVFLPLLLPIGFWAYYQKIGPAWRASLVLGVACLAVVLPWLSWSHAHKGTTGLTAFAGINLLTLIQPPPSFYKGNTPYEAALKEFCTESRELIPKTVPAELAGRTSLISVRVPCVYLAAQRLREQGFSQPDIDRRFLGFALAYILRHPVAYFRLAAREVLRFWSGYPLDGLGGAFAKETAQNRRDGDRVVLAIKKIVRIGAGILLSLLTLLGLYKACRRGSLLVIPAGVVISMTLLFGFFLVTDLRHRLPAEPFIILLILYGLKKKKEPATT